MPGNQAKRKKRRIEELDPVLYSYYLFCEGEKTEPMYFQGMSDEIHENPIYRHMVIEIKGTGFNTTSLLASARKYVDDHEIKNAQIWCVYDKDDFSDENFNLVEAQINEWNQTPNRNVRYYAAWSNQCIEYWFILHFAFYDANTDRSHYIEFLSERFKKLGLKKYEKNIDGIFRILQEHGNPRQAAKWAERQLDTFKGMTPAKSAPATKVHLLLKELARYLPETTRAAYLQP